MNDSFDVVLAWGLDAEQLLYILVEDGLFFCLRQAL